MERNIGRKLKTVLLREWVEQEESAEKQRNRRKTKIAECREGQGKRVLQKQGQNQQCPRLQKGQVNEN